MASRTVLIPLDGSETNVNIEDVVRRYIDPVETRLVLLHSVDTALGSGDLEKQAVDVEQRSLDDMPCDTPLCEQRERLIDDVERLRSAGYTVTGELRFGDTVQQIVEYVAEKQVALVALATPAYTGNGRPLPGSVADRVVRGLSVPVLLMRPNGE